MLPVNNRKLLVDTMSGSDGPVFVEQSGSTFVQESGRSPLTQGDLRAVQFIVNSLAADGTEKVAAV